MGQESLGFPTWEEAPASETLPPGSSVGGILSHGPLQFYEPHLSWGRVLSHMPLEDSGVPGSHLSMCLQTGPLPMRY